MTADNYIDVRDGGFYIKGTRVPLDSLVHEFRNGASPESIRQAFPVLSLEQVFGAITFYLGHKEKVDATILDAERTWSEFDATHPIPQATRERLREARRRTTSPNLSELKAAADRLAEVLADINEEEILTEFKQRRRQRKDAAR